MKRRDFIKNTTIGSVAFSGLMLDLNIYNSEDKLPKRGIIKDKLWLWGQNAGSHHGKTGKGYNLPGKNYMETKEGCDFFGINKTCRVTMGGYGPFPPFEGEAEKIKHLKSVVWSAIGDAGTKQHNNDQSDIDEVLKIAEKYPNISGAILDDFFVNNPPQGKDPARHSVASIRDIRDKLHNFSKRKLDFWVVLYTHQLNMNLKAYLDLFDVITLWTWNGSDLMNLDANFKKCRDDNPGKRFVAGCYMWNYGEKKPMTMDLMKHQLDRYYEWLKKGEIEGIIFCSNTIADLGLETVDYTRKWIAEKGMEKI